VGEGDVIHDGRRCAAREALTGAGLSPAALQAKEGIALINGTQLMTALGGLALAEALRLIREADVIGALTLDALLGTDAAFDARIHEIRPHRGQQISAANLRRLLARSPIRESHRGCGRVQDAYTLRCMPQVHGAVRDALAYVRSAVDVEMNAGTDNPLVFADSGDIVSGGNFHGEPIALAADVLAIAAAELGSISERRTERLVNPTLSELPAFLTSEGGLRSGLMIAQVTAASLVSENKVLAHPASVDTIPTSANKEDHVSMGATAASKARRVVANVRRVLAIEAIAACQALEFRRPLRTSPALEAARARLRAHVGAYDRDRPLSPDIEAAATLVEAGALADAAASVCGPLE
jgi:histidine ammonia-lyase